MPDPFPGLEPIITEPLTLTGHLGDVIEVSAYAGHVMLGIIQGSYEADWHGTVAEAKRLRANLDATIAAAEVLAIGDVVVIPIVAGPPA